MDKVDKDVDRVGVYPGALVAAGVENGGADVARECIWLGELWWWGVVVGGDRLSVEFVDNVDVGVVNGCNRGGSGCSCNGSAELVGISGALGSLVVASCSLCCVL